MNLFVSEMNRMLHRRALWVLLGVGLAVISFFIMLVLLSVDSGEDRRRWTFATETLLTMTLGTAMGLAMLLGGTLWGADFRHGTLGTLLTFVPDRRRVWATRTVVVALYSLGFALLMFLFSFLALAVFSGGAAVEQASWSGLFPRTVRQIVACVLAGLFGAFLATIFRNTAAAILVPLGYLFVRVLLLMTGMASGPSVFLPETYALAFLGGEVVIPPSDEGPSMASALIRIGWEQGLAVLIGLLAATGAVALLVFARRSVTE